ncbi:MAG: hypothetical protein IJB12_07125 [Methanocorpusculum sp.]|nr:hypothetical protein [Methanocorpusculum sp.]MBQ9832061.1 hypothetical protein [Methanocorpusculum sp.]
MSRTDDIIDKTKRKDSEAKKWKVIVGIVVGLVFGGALFACGLMICDVDNYLSKKDIVMLYDFYDWHESVNETAVYFIGNSVIGSAIYPPDINNILLDDGSDIKAYNLYISGESILERTLQINALIESNPSMVIYGITYADVSGNGSITSERAILVQDRINLNKDAEYLFTESELEDIYVNKPDLFFKKSFVKSAVSYKLFGSTDWNTDVDFYEDPRGMDHRLKKSNEKNYALIVAEANDEDNMWHPIVTNETTRSKDALLYIIKKLQDADIPVVIINMPLHPLISAEIDEESRENYFEFLNQTGVTWVDMENLFGDEYFYDSHHATWIGTQLITPVMADLIIQEMS